MLEISAMAGGKGDVVCLCGASKGMWVLVEGPGLVKHPLCAMVLCQGLTCMVVHSVLPVRLGWLDALRGGLINLLHGP